MDIYNTACDVSLIHDKLITGIHM